MTDGPKRYVQLAYKMEKSPHGEWVAWEDCRAALREIEELEAERDALKRELDNMHDLMRGAAKNMLKALEDDQ